MVHTIFVQITDNLNHVVYYNYINRGYDGSNMEIWLSNTSGLQWKTFQYNLNFIVLNFKPSLFLNRPHWPLPPTWIGKPSLLLGLSKSGGGKLCLFKVKSPIFSQINTSINISMLWLFSDLQRFCRVFFDPPCFTLRGVYDKSKSHTPVFH